MTSLQTVQGPVRVMPMYRHESHTVGTSLQAGAAGCLGKAAGQKFEYASSTSEQRLSADTNRKSLEMRWTERGYAQNHQGGL